MTEEPKSQSKLGEWFAGQLRCRAEERFPEASRKVQRAYRSVFAR